MEGFPNIGINLLDWHTSSRLLTRMEMRLSEIILFSQITINIFFSMWIIFNIVYVLLHQGICMALSILSSMDMECFYDRHYHEYLIHHYSGTADWQCSCVYLGSVWSSWMIFPDWNSSGRGLRLSRRAGRHGVCTGGAGHNFYIESLRSYLRNINILISEIDR